ncbi:MAG TPA: thioredoxin family protein [Bacteroidota bacterium]|nr:thioredoxin family protein [Bacteroidota bacterium]
MSVPSVFRSLIYIFVVAVLFSTAMTAQPADSAGAGAGAPRFDPTRDPAKDVSAAIDSASRSGKRILLDVGGEWCKWCHYLDRFFEQNKDVADFLHAKFVVVKVNYSKENKNEAFLNKYPKIPGYPHFFVLDGDGTFLYSQDTGELESGQGHDHDKVFAFLKKWAPK